MSAIRGKVKEARLGWFRLEQRREEGQMGRKALKMELPRKKGEKKAGDDTLCTDAVLECPVF